MSEMVERVARILDPEAWSNPSANMQAYVPSSQQLMNQSLLSGFPGAHLDQFERQRRQDASITQARRAIAALREPTAGMARAANDAFPDAPGEITCSALGSDLWRAMIDAALK